REHPVTVDLAYGRGIGDQIQFNNSVWSVAQDDFQMRAGIFLNRSLQVGVSGQYQRWDDMAGVEEDWKTGGFINWFSEEGIVVSIGMASGEQGSNGFASLSFQPGSHSRSPLGGKESVRPDYQFAPRTWMAAPVRRLQTVGVRKVTNHNFAQMQPANSTMLGGSLVGTYFVFGDPATRLGNPSDRIRATYTNTTNLPQTVTIVSIEQFDSGITNTSVTGTVNGGSSISAESNPSQPPLNGPYVQTVVISVNGQTFNVDLVFPDQNPAIQNGFMTAPVSVP
ncbi:MAG: hypothetical protein AAF357_06050, partial [Verrucomicrobiota bacterium]